MKLFFTGLVIVFTKLALALDLPQPTSENDKKEEITFLLDEAWRIRFQEPDSAILFLNRADFLAQTIADTSAQITAHIRKGAIFVTNGNWKKAETLFEQAIDLSLIIGDSIAQARALINLGQLYQQKGSFDKATLALYRSIDLLENTEHYNYKKVAYSTIGSIYLSLEKNKEAIEVYERLLNQSKDISDSPGMNRAYYNLGASYFNADSLDKALFYLDKSITISKALSDSMQLVQSLNLLGSINFTQENYPRAIAYFEQALPIAKRWGMYSEQVVILNNLGAVFEQLEQWSSAIKMYLEAAELSYDLGDSKNLYHIYLSLSVNYEKNNIPDSALFFYKKYSLLKDSIFNETSNLQILDIQEKYKSAKRDKNIADLKIIESEQKASIAKRQFWIIAMIVVTVLLIIMVMIYYSRLKMQSRLVETNQQLYQQRVLKLVQDNASESITSRLEGEMEERHRLANELHDQLGNQLVTAKLYYDQLEYISKDDETKSLFQKANTLLDTICVDVRKIAHNLSSDTLFEIGLDQSVTNLVNSIADSGQYTIQLQFIGTDESLHSHHELLIFRTIQELLTNIIKHADAKEIKLKIWMSQDYVKFSVSDDGKGFEYDEIQPGNGLGIKNINNRIDKLGGEFLLKSIVNQGTTIDISIPITQKIEENATL